VGTGPGRALLGHIVTAAEWAGVREVAAYAPPSLAAEGFVHLSTPEQLPASADRHYRGAGDLLALGIDPDRLTAELRWEHVPSRGEAFPHLYGPLNPDAVVAVADLSETAEGYELGAWQAI
jgi:uncharacterized protein (DUF952 family)